MDYLEILIFIGMIAIITVIAIMLNGYNNKQIPKEKIVSNMQHNTEKILFHRAVKADWRTIPLPEERMSYKMDRAFTHTEMSYITMGEEVNSQSDRWFIYWEENSLYFHRSQSGYCIFVVHFKKDDSLYRIDKIDMNNKKKQFTASESSLGFVTDYIDSTLKWKETEKFSDAEKEVLDEWGFNNEEILERS